MAKEYSKEQLQELYKVLPENLKKVVFSEKTSETVNKICLKNQLEKEKVEKITEYLNHVLLGLLSPENFEKALKEKIGLESNTVEKINQEIYQSIFFPLKEVLQKLYKTESKDKKQKNLPGTETADAYREKIN